MHQNRDELKKNLQASETPKIKKDVAVVTSDRYKTQKTTPLVFHFEAHPFESSSHRFEDAHIHQETISGKDVYIFDDFFIPSEADELREFSTTAHFSREIFADNESKTKGETPDSAMDNKEKWTFFANPPHPIQEIYKFLSWLAYKMNADIMTLPWELYDKDICVPAVATNRVKFKSEDSTKLGMHQDYNTEKGISFGIPILYSKKEGEIFPNSFVNGAEGKPWLISLMLYSTSEKFTNEHGLGTIFCNDKGKKVFSAASEHMRFVLFEGDIIHTIENSKLPQDEDVWRVSYVFKLVVNPKNEKDSMKKVFHKLVESVQKHLHI